MSPAAVRSFLARRFDPNSRLGVGLTIGAVLFAAFVWLFAGVLEEVLDNEGLVRWDQQIALTMHSHATPTGLHIFAAITSLGLQIVLVLVPVVTVILWRMRRRRLLLLWLGANVGGKALEFVLKHSVQRTRPEYGAAFLHGESYSFPSGHAMGAMVCYLTLAYIIASLKPAWTTFAYAAAVPIIIAIGASRIYLGVHYPSDVLGGYAAAGAWLAVCLTATRIAERPVKQLVARRR